MERNLSELCFLYKLATNSNRWAALCIKSQSTALSSAVNKSQQHQEKNSREHKEFNPGLLVKKQVCYLCAMQPLLSPPTPI